MKKPTRQIRMADPHFAAEDREWLHREVDAVLDGQLSMGPNVQAFEREFAAMSGTAHAVALNSCTSALEIALTSQLVAGGEVIVPAETFIATGMAVHFASATPVFAEISPSTFCLDLDDVARRVTPRTRGIILVYMGGQIPPEIDRFVEFCRDRNLFLIEDAAHAPGAIAGGRAAGGFGLAGCFSFFPTKVMTAGEGGMLTTNDPAVAAHARSQQHRGRDMASKSESYISPGQNRRMTEITALTGRVQLKRLPEYLAQRQAIAGLYRAGMRGDDRATVILPPDLAASACWKIPTLLRPGLNRVRLTEAMAARGVAVDWAYYPPMHLQPVFREQFGHGAGELPITEDLLSRHVCLPCHPRMSIDDAGYVVDALKESLDEQAR